MTGPFRSSSGEIGLRRSRGGAGDRVPEHETGGVDELGVEREIFLIDTLEQADQTAPDQADQHFGARRDTAIGRRDFTHEGDCRAHQPVADGTAGGFEIGVMVVELEKTEIVGMGDGEGHHLPPDATEAGLEIAARAGRRDKNLEHRLLAFGQRRVDQSFLGLEIAINRPGGDTRPLRNVGDRGAEEAVTCEKRHCGVDDRGALVDNLFPEARIVAWPLSNSIKLLNAY